MAELGRYPHEVRAIADELEEMLERRYRSATARVAAKLGEDGLFRMTPEESERALKLLAAPPSQRDKTLSRLDDDTAATLVMRARFFGLLSVRAMELSERFNYVRGQGYRQAAAYGARQAMDFRLTPSLAAVMPSSTRSFDDDDDDLEGSPSLPRR